jgi:hypothetical protein
MKVFDPKNPKKNWRYFLFLNGFLISLAFLLITIVLLLSYRFLNLYDTASIKKMLDSYMAYYAMTIFLILILPIVFLVLSYYYFLLKKRRNKKWKRKRYMPYSCRYCMFSDFNCAFEKGAFVKEKSMVYSNRYLSSELHAYQSIRLRERLKTRAKSVFKSTIISLCIFFVFILLFIFSSYLSYVSFILIFHLLLILTLSNLAYFINKYYTNRKQIHKELSSFTTELVHWKVKCSGFLLRSKDVLWYFNHYWISKIPEKLRFDGLGITVIVDDYPIMLYVHKKSIYFSYNIFVSAIIPSFSFFSEEILPNKLNENTKIAIKKNRLVVDGKETSISIDFTNPGLTLSARLFIKVCQF